MEENIDRERELKTEGAEEREKAREGRETDRNGKIRVVSPASKTKRCLPHSYLYLVNTLTPSIAYSPTDQRENS